MAERQRGILSEENQPTIIAVCFVLALMGTVFGIYDLLQVRSLSLAATRASTVSVEAVNTQLSAASTRIADLEKRLADLEKKAAESAAATAIVPADGQAKTP